MFKISKNLFLTLLISLSWSQLEYAPEVAEGENNVVDQPTKISEEQKDKEEELSKAKEKLGLEKERNYTENEINKAHKDSIEKHNKSLNKFFESDLKFNEAHELLIKDAKARKTEEDVLEKAAEEEARKKEQAQVEANQKETEKQNKITNYIQEKLIVEDSMQDLKNKLDEEFQINDSIEPYKTLIKNTIYQKINDLIRTNRLSDLSADFFTEITKDQIKALFEKPDLLTSLKPEQIKKLDPQALAEVIKGEATMLGKKWRGKNPLPESFIDTLDSNQAEAIIDSKGFLSDHNYYLSDTQIKILENKVKTKKDNFSEKVADARNILVKLLDQKLLDSSITLNSRQSAERTKLIENFKESMATLSTKDQKQVVSEYTDAITKQEKSKLFGLKKLLNNKKLMTDLKNQLNTFINDFVNPSLNDNEWAFEYTDPKTNKLSIKIIDMYKALNRTTGKNFIDSNFPEKEGLTLAQTEQEYGKWFVGKNLDLSKPITLKFNENIKQYIDTALREKINKELNEKAGKDTLKLANLDSSYIQFVDVSKLTNDQIKALTADQIKALTADQIKALTVDQITALTVDQITALTDEQAKTLTDEQIKALTNNLLKLNQNELNEIKSKAAEKIKNLIDELSKATTKIQSLFRGSQGRADAKIEKIRKEIENKTPDQIINLQDSEIQDNTKLRETLETRLNSLSITDLEKIVKSDSKNPFIKDMADQIRLKKMLDPLKEELSKLESEKDSNSAQAKQQAEADKVKITQLEEELQKNQQNMEERLQEQEDKHKQELKRTKQLDATKIRAMESELDLLRSEIKNNDATTNNKSLQENNAALNRKIKELEQELGTTKQKYDNLARSLQEATSTTSQSNF